jgi:hypothetical protein
MRLEGQPIYGNEQSTMKYSISSIISNAGGQISFFNTVMVRWPSNTRNPSYGTNPDKVWLPSVFARMIAF